METVIKKAIDGGWDVRISHPTPEGIKIAYEIIAKQKRFLFNPLFWQALGKAEGWDGTTCYDCACHHDVPMFENAGDPCVRHVWHRLIDHLAANKSPDSFFEQLLANK